MRKDRSDIAEHLVDRLLFDSDRTCCVCREPGKRLRIHFVDHDASNQKAPNLAVLCLECVGETGKGGRLDAASVVEQRDEWHGRVVTRRHVADELASGRVLSSGPREGDLHGYLELLPAVKREAYRRARELGDSAIQTRGSYDVVDVLTRVLVYLAQWYPEGHFGDRPAAEHLAALVASRFAWHRALLEPGGTGTGGPILGPLTAGAVMSDVETMVADMVRSLTLDVTVPRGEAEFDFKGWQQEWRRAKQLSANRPPPRSRSRARSG